MITYLLVSCAICAVGVLAAIRATSNRRVRGLFPLCAAVFTGSFASLLIGLFWTQLLPYYFKPADNEVYIYTPNEAVLVGIGYGVLITLSFLPAYLLFYCIRKFCLKEI